MKTCSKYQSEPNANRPNPQFTQIGFANDLFRLKPLKMAEMVFVLVVSGFVISEIWSEWNVINRLLAYFPDMIIKPLALNNKLLIGFIKGSAIFAIFPLIIWLLPFLISRLTGATLKMKDYFLNYGIAFVPIIAAAHLDKAILKASSRIPYFEHLFDDVSGVSTAHKIIDGQIILQQMPFWLNFVVSILLTLVIVAGVCLSIMVVKRLNQKQNFEKTGTPNYLIPVVYGSIFLIMILAWRWF
jgi:hypothetical protein